MNVCLVTFATKGFRLNQTLLNSSMLNYGGISKVSVWNRKRLQDTKFYQENREILDEKKGAGYWLWKPYIILEELERAKTGDYIVYSDSGKKPICVKRSIAPLLKICSDNNGIMTGVKIHWWGPNNNWTRKNCFVGMDCNSDEYRNHPQIQASPLIWQKGDASLSFVKQWLGYCMKKEVLFGGRGTHRFDQSVLTNCAIKENVFSLEIPTPDPFFMSKNIDYLLGVVGEDEICSLN